MPMPEMARNSPMLRPEMPKASTVQISAMVAEASESLRGRPRRGEREGHHLLASDVSPRPLVLAASRETFRRRRPL